MKRIQFILGLFGLFTAYGAYASAGRSSVCNSLEIPSLVPSVGHEALADWPWRPWYQKTYGCFSGLKNPFARHRNVFWRHEKATCKPANFVTAVSDELNHITTCDSMLHWRRNVLRTLSTAAGAITSLVSYHSYVPKILQTVALGNKLGGAIGLGVCTGAVCYAYAWAELVFKDAKTLDSYTQKLTRDVHTAAFDHSKIVDL